jgi:transcriptional regulator with XRE-family HTH domain
LLGSGGGANVGAMTARKSRRKAVAKRKVEVPAEAVSSLDDAAATLRAGLQSVLVRGLGALTGGVSERLAASSGVGLRVGKALLLSPESARMRREAGRTLRELRKVAGLTVDELAEAIELSDHSLLAAVEKGTATLSFELILRLSALLARNDPVPFVVQMTRTYNPALWKLLEGWGIVRIPLQMERERRFLNVYRAHDVARKLSDASFDHVLAFTQSAFEMALHLAAAEEGLDENGAKRPARRARRPRRQNV